MANLLRLAFLFFGVYFLRTQAADKYTDENRPYEFGFTIDGEQHRHEKKDENGIIMGEFGFITADGVYHVTVYATDENGNFKILSMKNIRVKPYPTSPGAAVKKSNSLPVTAPPKDSIPESTKEEKTIKKQIASPAKSCSHCRLPTTTTTTTTVSPDISKISSKLTNSQSPEILNRYQNDEDFTNNNPISLQNAGDQEKDYNSKTDQSSPPIVAENNRPEQQNNKNDQNRNLLPSHNLGHQESNKPMIPQSHLQDIINNENYPQQDVVSNNPVQAINPAGQQYSTPENRPLSTELGIVVPDVEENNPGLSNVDSTDSQHQQQPIQHPISRSLQVPLNDDIYIPNSALTQNQEADNGVTNSNQNDFNNNNNNNPEAQSYPQQQNYEQYNKIVNPNNSPIPSTPTIISQETKQPKNGNEKSALGNPKSDRSPKSFSDFIQQSVDPEEIPSTGPNLYRPSLPKASEFSGKPVLLAAQMQKVDKNTNIYNKNPGENDGLPEGITIDDMNNLLYTFNYSVGFHGHHEKGYSNGAKQGYYYVTGRNGVRTRVDYVADEKGFRPKITQEILDLVSDEVPKPETEKEERYGLKGYEFKWLYFPLDSKPTTS